LLGEQIPRLGRGGFQFPQKGLTTGLPRIKNASRSP